MKRIKKRNIIAVCIVGLFVHLCFSSPVDKTIDGDYLNMLAALRQISQDQGDVNLEVRAGEDVFGKNLPSTVRPNYNALLTQFEQHDVLVAYFFQHEDSYTATFIFDSFLPILHLGSWSYQYSSNGYTEQYQVKSVDEAIKHSQSAIQHFCEPANFDNWFVCFN